MRKKLIILLFSLNALLLGGILVLTMLVNKESVKGAVVASFHAATGLALEVQGETEINIFPLPHVIIHSLYVSNVQGASTPFLLSMNTIDVTPSFRALLSGKMALDYVDVKGLKVELERLKDGSMNWKKNSAAEDEAHSGGASVSGSFGLRTTGSQLHFSDAATGKVTEFKDISLLISETSPGRNALQASFRVFDQAFTANGEIGNPLEMASAPAPVKIAISAGKTSFTYDGQAGFKDGGYVLDGSMVWRTADLVPWLSLMIGSPPDAAGATYSPLPLNVSARISGNTAKTEVTGISLGGEFIKGAAQATFTGGNHADIKAFIDSLDGEALAGSRLFRMKIPGMEVKRDEFGAEIVPSSAFSLGASIRVADTTYNAQHIKDVALDFDLSGTSMVFTRAEAHLPGETLLVFTGGLGKESDLGFSAEGRLDARGSDLSQAMTVFKASGFAIPGQDFKRFALQANALFSAKEARFSEFAGRIENMGLRGGIIVSFDRRTRLLAALRIGGINLDRLLVLWGFNEWENSFRSEIVGGHSDALLSQWLKKLGFDIELTASLEKYVLGGQERERADFKLSAGEGRIDVTDLAMSYNGSALSGRASLNVKESPPRVNLDLGADTFDTDTFFGPKPTPVQESPAPAPSMEADRWSHAGFDLHWFELLNGNFHFRFGHFKHKKFDADALEVQGGIDGRKLTVDSLRGIILGARVLGRAVLSGGKIPMLNLAGVVSDLDSSALSLYIPSLQSLNGNYNLKMTFNTSGIDMNSWISNLAGTVGVAGRGVVIHGFNLPGIIQAVGYVRTVADILKVVQRAFPGGDTGFSSAAGQWTVYNGVLRTGDMQFTNEQSLAQVAAEINLMTWKIRSHVLFTLKSLDPLHPPTMAVNMTGDLDKPEKTLDTRNLEQYVTQRTSEKILKK